MPSTSPPILTNSRSNVSERLITSRPKETNITLTREGSTKLTVDRPQGKLLGAMIVAIIIFQLLVVGKDLLLPKMTWTMLFVRVLLLIVCIVILHFMLKPLPWYMGQQTIEINLEDFSITTWKVLFYHTDFTYKWKNWINTSRRHKIQGKSKNLVSAQMSTLGTNFIMRRFAYVGLVEGKDKVHKFGFGLSSAEREWIVDEINDFLQALVLQRSSDSV